MCYFCASPLPEGPVYRNTLCPECQRELKTCHNCDFFAPGYQYDCRESISEAVFDKDAANFCDYFSKRKKPFGKNPGQAKSSSARDAFNNLFGD